MNHKNNRRSASTKQRIKQALISMVQVQPFSKITVRSLCDAAEINRSTFYNHYSSPSDVFNGIKNDFLLSITEVLKESCDLYSSGPRQNAIEDLMTAILTFIQEHAQLCLILKDSDISPTLARQIMNEPVIKDCFLRSISGEYSAEDMEYLYEYTQYGAFHIIDMWLLRGCDCSPRDMAKRFAFFMSRF